MYNKHNSEWFIRCFTRGLFHQDFPNSDDTFNNVRLQSKVRTKEGVKDFSFHVKESYLAGLDIFASQASPIFQYICQVRFQQEFRVTRKKNSYEKKTKEGKMKKRKLIW